MTLGEVFAERYQVVGKLGFGTSSTVWLAWDVTYEYSASRELLTSGMSRARKYAELKVLTRGEDHNREYETCKRISDLTTQHPGFFMVRSVRDTITIPREGGDHLCLVQKPLWGNPSDLIARTCQHLTEDLLKACLQAVLLVLDFLHTECKLVHTDIKDDNILIGIDDSLILNVFVKAELKHPPARKVENGVTVYASRPFELPKRIGPYVLGDIGEAVSGDVTRYHDAQPKIYRAPEVMIEADWSYAVDIWNVGTMTWDLFDGKHLFTGEDPEGEGYLTKTHLAELIGMLGPPPQDLLKRGRRIGAFFDGDRTFIAGVPIVQKILEEVEGRLEGQSQEAFLTSMRKMLWRRPEDRATARDLP